MVAQEAHFHCWLHSYPQFLIWRANNWKKWHFSSFAFKSSSCYCRWPKTGPVLIHCGGTRQLHRDRAVVRWQPLKLKKKKGGFVEEMFSFSKFHHNYFFKKHDLFSPRSLRNIFLGFNFFFFPNAKTTCLHRW